MFSDLDSWDELRVRARDLIGDGRLPRQFSRDISAGFGSDNACVLCGHPIASHQVEFPVLLGPVEWLALHVRCYRAWRDESQEGYAVIQSHSALGPSELCRDAEEAGAEDRKQPEPTGS